MAQRLHDSGKKRNFGSGKSPSKWGAPVTRSQLAAQALPTPPPSRMTRAAVSSPNLAALNAAPAAENSLKHLSTGRVRVEKRLGSAATQPANNSIFRSFHSIYEMDTSGLLGTGGYAVVRQATHKQTGKVYAVKIMVIGRKSEESEDGDSAEDDTEEEEGDDDDDEKSKLDMTMSFEEIMNEIELVAQLEHPNIIKYHEYFINPSSSASSSASAPSGCSAGKKNNGPGSGGGEVANAVAPTEEGRTHVYIVMDLLEGPTLVDALASLKSGYTEADVKILLERLLDAVHYMHLNGVTHRDLKLENLMLASKDGSDLRTVTVIDFGLAKAARARDRMEDACGTLWYYAPELVKGIPFLPVVDEWAVGVCMHVLLSGEFPFDHEDEDELEDLIIAADMSKIRCIHNSPEDDDADNDDDEEDEDDGGIVIGEEDEAVKSRGGGATSSSSSSSPPPSLWSKISAEARDLLLGLLNPAPMKRLTAQAALGHSFFSGSSSGDSVTLWHVHARLEKLSSQANLPRHSFSHGEFLVDTVDDLKQQQKQQQQQQLQTTTTATPMVKKPVRSLSSNSLSALAEEFAAGDDEAEGGDGEDVGLTLESSSLLSPSSSSSSSSSPFQRTPARKKEAPPPTIFMIHEGVCEVLRVIVNDDDDDNNDNALNGDDGGNDDDESGLSFEHVGFRRKGNFVSSDPSQILDLKGKQNNPFGAAGGNGSVERDARYVVRAQGPVVVVVLDPSDMKWAQEHDFRLESELHKAMHSRRKILAALSSDAGHTTTSLPPAASSSSPTLQPPGSPVTKSSPSRQRRDINDIGISTRFAPGGEPVASGVGSGHSASAGGAGGAGGAEKVAASPRSLTGLSGDLLGRLGGTTEEDQRQRFKVGLKVMLAEYMEAGDIGEFARCLGELDAVCGFNKCPFVVKQAVSSALDRGDREKELIAVLLEALAPGMLSKAGMESGLASLAMSSHDLAFDVPSAVSADIPIYLARAVITGTVAPDFLVALAASFRKEGLVSEAPRHTEELIVLPMSSLPPPPQMPAGNGPNLRQPSSFSSLLTRPKLKEEEEEGEEEDQLIEDAQGIGKSPPLQETSSSPPSLFSLPPELELPPAVLAPPALVASPSFGGGHRFSMGASQTPLLTIEASQAGEKVCKAAMQLLSKRYESGVMDVWDRETSSETVELLEEDFKAIIEDFVGCGAVVKTQNPPPEQVVVAAVVSNASKLDEAARKLWNLKVPHFHHAFVKKLLLRAVAIKESGQGARSPTSPSPPLHRGQGLGGDELSQDHDHHPPDLLELLAFVASSGLVSTTQLRLGYHRSEEEHTQGGGVGKLVEDSLRLALSQMRVQARTQYGIPL